MDSLEESKNAIRQEQATGAPVVKMAAMTPIYSKNAQYSEMYVEYRIIILMLIIELIKNFNRYKLSLFV